MRAPQPQVRDEHTGYGADHPSHDQLAEGGEPGADRDGDHGRRWQDQGDQLGGSRERVAQRWWKGHDGLEEAMFGTAHAAVGQRRHQDARQQHGQGDKQPKDVGTATNVRGFGPRLYRYLHLGRRLITHPRLHGSAEVVGPATRWANGDWSTV